MIGKIAVFICGPERFLPQVIKNLESTFSEYEYDNFIFIWDEDKDNRSNSSDISENINYYRKNSKVLHVEKPFNEEQISRRFGGKVLGHSSKKAMLGMFYSVSVLCDVIKKHPDFKEYTHILRVRTDSIFFDSFTLDDYKDGSILVADNPIIPSNWVSDHLMFAPINKFLKVWGVSSLKRCNILFIFSSNNPELLLKLKSFRYAFCVKKNIKRYEDYHIVYTYNESEPSYIKKYMERDIFSLFENPPLLEQRKNYYQLKKNIRNENEKKILKKISSSFFGRLVISLFKGV
ncbi:hypothetical protein [Photobacterium sp. Alg240-V54]|uniref:hypothetical protein n=1 Tax=Photobacterium sp. Alg240-V54 TaxID=2305995 RepID=UPI0013D3E2B1|nr:hypothetical protein [Photobacterium sp. Alg240-V54]